MLKPGERLGPYQILASIGAGGMGEVYKALDTRLGRPVAVKTLRATHGARFLREARAIAALNHAHICQLYDVGPDYLVMEFIEGARLQGPLPPSQALEYALQICDALDAAHGKGIVHRDLKPGNILVTVAGVKLLDFGLAKIGAAATAADSESTLTGTLTEIGAVMGTIAYMSPEQARGEEIDARSDIFSYGAVLYEMLSGRAAFARTSPAETMAAIIRDEPAPLDSPPTLRAVVARCLRKSSAERFQTAGELRRALEQLSVKPAKTPAIAVLPFLNLSADKENEYFSDGLAEEIINSLAHMPGLRVIARTSAFAFRGKEEDIRKIAEVLGVSTVLEGSVRRVGNRVRVTAQLIETENGTHLWSERFDGEMTDVFAVQDEIAAAIAKTLQVKLAVVPAELPRYTPRLSAYEAYLKARHHWTNATPDSLARSKEFYEQAIELDPDFALAYVGLADYFLMLAAGAALVPAHEVMPRVRSLAQRAIDINPGLPEAHGMLAVVAGIYDYNWGEAERFFRLAMAREPVPPYVRAWYGYFHLLCLARTEPSARECEAALDEDPLNHVFRICLASSLAAAGKYEEANKECHRILETDANFFHPYSLLAWFHAAQGKTFEALRFAEGAYSVAPWHSHSVAVYAALLRQTGNKNRSDDVLRNVLDTPEAYGSARTLMVFHIVCGDIEAAFGPAETAVKQRDPYVATLSMHLRGGVRWPSFAKAMNLPV